MRPITPWCSCVPAASRSHEPDGVGVVHHHHRVVLVGQVADRREVGDVAVHGEDAVGGDQPQPRTRGLLQLRLQVGHVVVAVAEALGLAEADAVDDAGVVQLVGDDGVLLAEQRLEQPAVGVEAGGVEDRVVGAEELAERCLELLVDVLRAADEADGRQAVAPVGRAPAWAAATTSGWLGEAEVVVGAEVEDRRSSRPRTTHRRASLGRRQDALRLLESGLADLPELLGERTDEPLSLVTDRRPNEGAPSRTPRPHRLEPLLELRRRGSGA